MSLKEVFSRTLLSTRVLNKEDRGLLERLRDSNRNVLDLDGFVRPFVSCVVSNHILLRRLLSINRLQ